ncbi:MAG: cation diffusion facilitator family transporter [Oscillospiraceae bacterium]|nr:cation diffusion facilitator family transporter [Oscillospiraceae bacterium]MCD7742713.1 cation diffusion facilitator family transporter [Oscillospiraceae bacterium]MCD7786264.1 cation diffusion facilitator family transporter [Oscillospiraceae bacterium]MCD8256213.1 cation diffusion facilitator family transporter [Oscillospiraceae bacterium]
MKNRELQQPEDFAQVAARVSAVSIAANLALSLFKAFAGVAAHSGAMVSDAVHSASDVFSSIIVLIGVRLSVRESDAQHPYGHERFECVAAALLAVVLFVTGLLIGYGALRDIFGGNYQNLEVPGVLSLVAAAVSIVCKEGMYWYTRFWAVRCDSGALMADAWHHRSDALSSVGVLIGIAGARMGFPVLDPVASLVICVFILKAGYDIFRDALGKMIDRACDPDTERALHDCISGQEGVLHVDLLHTREFGNRIYVDVEIGADGTQSLAEGHRIAERVHAAVEREFPKVKHIMVHVNPQEPPRADDG